MKRFLLTALFMVPLAACSTHYYHDDEASMMTVDSTKESCSCVFVLGLDESRCADYSRLIGPRQVVILKVDREEHTVEGSLLGYKAKARYVNHDQGCVLVD